MIRGSAVGTAHAASCKIGRMGSRQCHAGGSTLKAASGCNGEAEPSGSHPIFCRLIALYRARDTGKKTLCLRSAASERLNPQSSNTHTSSQIWRCDFLLDPLWPSPSRRSRYHPYFVSRAHRPPILEVRQSPYENVPLSCKHELPLPLGICFPPVLSPEPAAPPTPVSAPIPPPPSPFASSFMSPFFYLERSDTKLPAEASGSPTE